MSGTLYFVFKSFNRETFLLYLHEVDDEVSYNTYRVVRL